MRNVAISMLILGVAIGWFARDLTFDKTSKRTERSDQRAEAPAPPRDRSADTIGETLRPPANVKTAPETQPAPEPVTVEDEPQDDPLGEMIKAQSPQWKAWASMQAKQKADGAFKDLGLDAETEARIEEAIVAESERQAERAILMMLGEEEMDVNAFTFFMGLPGELSPELEAELGTFLTGAEIEGVRQTVKQGHEKQMKDMADMQIKMMGISDLSDDQKTRLRDVYVGKDMMTRQMTQFAEVTRDRKRLNKLLTGDGDTVAKIMEKQFEPQRRRVRDILNNEQFERYKKYEKQMIKQAEMGLKMMSSMLKRPSKTSTPAGK